MEEVAHWRSRNGKKNWQKIERLGRENSIVMTKTVFPILINERWPYLRLDSLSTERDICTPCLLVCAIMG